MARSGADTPASPARSRTSSPSARKDGRPASSTCSAISACAEARVRLNDLLNAIPLLQRNIDHTATQHTAIVEAILAGDTRRAQRAVAEHLDGTAALLRGFLE